jgi:nitroreductase
MELNDAIAARRSVRAFRKRPVEPAKLDAILRAANAAPSAGNLQGYAIVAVRDAKARARLAEASLGQAFVAEAPVALVFCADARRSGSKYGRRGETLYAVQDATIAAAYAQLAAVDAGLATVWVGAFDDAAVAEVVGAPPHARPVAILPVGYAAEKPEAAGRRALEDLVHAERFRG